MSHAQAIRAKRRIPFCDLLTKQIDRPENNLASESARLGKNESTVRGWTERERSPDVDWLILERDRLSDALRFDILVQLAGDRFVVRPSE